MSDDEKLRWVEEIRLPIMEACAEVGWVSEVRRMIPIYRKRVETGGRQDLLSRMEKLEVWLAAAEEYELIHGVKSKFRDDHPFIVSARAYLKSRTSSEDSFPITD